MFVIIRNRRSMVPLIGTGFPLSLMTVYLRPGYQVIEDPDYKNEDVYFDKTGSCWILVYFSFGILYYFTTEKRTSGVTDFPYLNTG